MVTSMGYKKRYYAEILRDSLPRLSPCCECGEDGRYIFGCKFPDELKTVWNWDQVFCSYKCWLACH